MSNTSSNTDNVMFMIEKIIEEEGEKIQMSKLKIGISITIIVLVLSILLYRFLLPPYAMYSLLLIYTIVLFWQKLDARIPIAAALLLLLITPFYLIAHLENYANYLAMQAYFFLVIGVLQQLVDYVAHGN
jgi:hypothetical protein